MPKLAPMQLSGTYRSLSGNAGPGEVTITPVNSRQPVQVVEAGDDGAWESSELATGTFKVAYASGWSTTVLAVGDISGIGPTVASPGSTDWEYLVPNPEDDWEEFISPGGDSRPRIRTHEGFAFIEGSVSGGVASIIGESEPIEPFPEAYAPDRTTFLLGACADMSSEDPGEWVYGTAFFSVQPTGNIYLLSTTLATPPTWVAFVGGWPIA